jgi:hypothetical protein
MRKTITLIFLDLELVHHFIDGTGIGSSTTVYSRSGTAVLGSFASGRRKANGSVQFCARAPEWRCQQKVLAVTCLEGDL